MNPEQLANNRSRWGNGIILPLTHSLICILTLFCLSTCGGSSIGTVKRIGDIPHEYDKHGVWVPLWIRFPQSLSKAEIAAVGVYGPTRYPEYGREKAIENGRNELSRSFSVRVQNLVKDWAIDRESYFTSSASSQRFTEEITRQTTDVELSGTVVKAFWVHPVEKMNYALVSVSLDEAKQSAISTVRRIGETQGDLFIDETVDEAFEELDRVLQQTKPEDF
jgi:hypothetical protein